MFPDQHQQSGPQKPYQSQPAPASGVPGFQQDQNGTYGVVPPLVAGQNSGHSGHNPYEFIVNPNTPKRRSLVQLHGKRSLLLYGSILIAVVLVLGLLVSLIAPKNNVAIFLPIAQRQQEIDRIAAAAIQQASDQETINFASTVEITIMSDQQQTLAYMHAHGVKYSAKTLALDQSTRTDSVLANAASANQYDSVVAQTLTSELNQYHTGLQSAFTQVRGSPAKQLLQANYGHTSLLLQQAAATQKNSNN